MGNRRSTYLIGAMISAVSITLILGAVVPAYHALPTASTGLNSLGHLTLEVHNPDGTAVYRQTDNFVMIGFLNAIDNAFFVDGTLPATFQTFKWLALCTSATPQDNTACVAELTATGRLDGKLGSDSGATAAAVGNAASRTLSNSFTIDVGDDGAIVNRYYQILY